MITITLPEWLGWLIVAVASIHGLVGCLDLYRWVLQRRLDKLKAGGR